MGLLCGITYVLFFYIKYALRVEKGEYGDYFRYFGYLYSNLLLFWGCTLLFWGSRVLNLFKLSLWICIKNIFANTLLYVMYVLCSEMYRKKVHFTKTFIKVKIVVVPKETLAVHLVFFFNRILWTTVIFIYYERSKLWNLLWINM